MKNVVISESLFNAMVEQLGYWQSICADDEGYLAGIMDEVVEVVNPKTIKTVGLFEELPTPSSTEDMVLQGTGSFQKLWKASDVTPRGSKNKVFTWKLVGIN